MIKAIVSDFSDVILFAKEEKFVGNLDILRKGLSLEPTYKAFDNFYLNTELLDLYRSLLETVDFYIFTSEPLPHAPEFSPYLEQIFQKTFFTKTMSVLKKQSQSYIAICKELSLLPADVLYIDNEKENVKAAKLAGLSAIHFTDNDSAIKKIKILLL